MSVAAKLSVVAAALTPQARWLTLSELIKGNDAAGRNLKAERSALKVEIMTAMRCWGMSDEQITFALGGEV